MSTKWLAYLVSFLKFSSTIKHVTQKTILILMSPKMPTISIREREIYQWKNGQRMLTDGFQK
jgi:hypothetical protein